MILQMDCIAGMREYIEDKTVALVVTDIPYGVVSRKTAGLRQFDKGAADIETFALSDFIKELSRIVYGSAYIFCATEQVSELRSLMITYGMTTRLCIWEKSNPSPVNGQHLWLSGVECCVFGRFSKATFNEHCKVPVWRYPVGSSKVHPTQKPVALFTRLIEASSNPGDLVVDPCLGSGTTYLACLNTDRLCIGFEADATYAALAQDRVDAAMQKVAA